MKYVFGLSLEPSLLKIPKVRRILNQIAEG